MLTSIYYYNYYKPYLYATDSTPKNKRLGKAQSDDFLSRYSGIETKDYIHNNSEDSAYLMNYADKNELKNIISGISDNVNGIKDTVRYLQNVKGRRESRFDGGKAAYGDGLEDLASDINSLISFSSGKDVSGGIKKFAGEVKQIAQNNTDAFKEVGLEFDGEKATFDRLVFDSLSSEEYEQKSRNLRNVLSEIYDDSVNVLSKPMSSHLNFKNLNFYYNYSYSTKSKEALGFIESGLVVDILL